MSYHVISPFAINAIQALAIGPRASIPSGAVWLYLGMAKFARL